MGSRSHNINIYFTLMQIQEKFEKTQAHFRLSLKQQITMIGSLCI